MQNNLAEHLPLAERAQFLRDNCDKTEDMNYMKKFTPDEVEAMKSRLSTVDIDMNDLEEEKKDMATLIKAKIDPLKTERKDLLTNIKQKAIMVKEECFKFLDHENGRVGYYNQVGDLIEERPMMPDERQRNMFPIRDAQGF